MNRFRILVRIDESISRLHRIMPIGNAGMTRNDYENQSVSLNNIYGFAGLCTVLRDNDLQRYPPLRFAFSGNGEKTNRNPELRLD
jgi:hypothetical protein